MKSINCSLSHSLNKSFLHRFVSDLSSANKTKPSKVDATPPIQTRQPHPPHDEPKAPAQQKSETQTQQQIEQTNDSSLTKKISSKFTSFMSKSKPTESIPSPSEL